MTRKKLLVLLGSVCLALMMVAMACAGPAPTPTPSPTPSPTPAPEKIVLKAVCVGMLDDPAHIGLLRWVELVNQRAEGELFINVIGGPEVIPAFEQVEAVRLGTIDVSLNYGTYFSGVIPECIAWTAGRLTPPEEREVGAYDLWAKLFREKANAMFLGRFNWGVSYRIFSNPRIENPREDFKGLVIRGTTSGIAFMERLGGSIHIAPWSECYTGMERGVFDGFTWVLPGLYELGFHEVTKYCFDVPWFRGSTSGFVNLDAWNRLPKHLQELLIDVSVEVERDAGPIFVKQSEEAKKLLQGGGMEFIKPSAEDAEWFLDVLYDATWGWVAQEAPEYGPQLRAFSFPGGS